MSNIDFIRDVSAKFTESTQGDPWSIGSRHQRDRLRLIVEHVLKSTPGDILEIGSHRGITTNIFCGIARGNNRKVVSIDPYNGEQQGNQSVYEQFNQTNQNNWDVLTQHRVSSQSQQARDVVKNQQFAFAFIDGLHTVEGCKSDIELCKGIPFQAVDDLTWSPGLLELFNKQATLNNYTHYHDPQCREGYYIANP